MLFLVHQYVHDKSDVFKWDNDGLAKAMNNVTNTSRRDFVFSIEEELKARESEWKEKWDETTLDFMWHMFKGIVVKHAKMLSTRQSIQVNCTSTSRKTERI